MLPLYPGAVLDINQEGNLDIAAPSGWAPGDGAGHFGTVTPFPGLVAGLDGGAPPPDPSYESLALGDFNADGLVDVAQLVFNNYNQCGIPTNCTPVGVAVSLGMSPGTFGAPAALPSAGTVFANDYAVLLAGDVNGDGALDLVVPWTAGRTALGS